MRPCCILFALAAAALAGCTGDADFAEFNESIGGLPASEYRLQQTAYASLSAGTVSAAMTLAEAAANACSDVRLNYSFYESMKGKRNRVILEPKGNAKADGLAFIRSFNAKHGLPPDRLEPSCAAARAEIVEGSFFGTLVELG